MYRHGYRVTGGWAAVRLSWSLLAAVGAVSCAHLGGGASSALEAPRLVWRPPLVYPADLYDAGVEGSVVLEAVVDTTGWVDPGSIHVVRSTHAAFEAPATEMLRHSRFSPGRRGGRLVPALIVLPVRFTLEQDVEVTQADSLEAARLHALGEQLGRRGKIDDAMAAYTRAQQLDGRLASRPSFWRGLCWNGSLWGRAADVMAACEQAVALAPDRPWTREARGVARALIGDSDGAVADLEAYLRCTVSIEERDAVSGWITALRGGGNPFTSQVLDSLRRRAPSEPHCGASSVGQDATG